MKLAGTAVNSDQIDLYLTINFNEPCKPIAGGSVAFGFKRGELTLKLENSKIPYEFRELTGSIELSLEKETQEPENSQAQSGVEPSRVQSQTGTKAGVGTEPTEVTIAPFQCVACQVTTKGSQTNPAWVFEVETGETVLKGVLKKAKLATLKAIALPCYVEATFDVSLRDIYLTQVEGLWSPNLSRNQLAVLQRGIARLLLKRKLKPYLSRVELQYD
jgi:hypothetical protein